MKCSKNGHQMYLISFVSSHIKLESGICQHFYISNAGWDKCYRSMLWSSLKVILLFIMVDKHKNSELKVNNSHLRKQNLSEDLQYSRKLNRARTTHLSLNVSSIFQVLGTTSAVFKVKGSVNQLLCSSTAKLFTKRLN